MSEEQEFQYVVSKEDYSNFKTTQVKCQQLAKLLDDSQTLHSQDKQKYLKKIDQLQDQLKSYKNSIRQYLDKEVKEIDDLLKVLSEYKSMNSKSLIDEKALKKMKAQCDKISQTFNVSLKALQIINSEVITIIKSLAQDSLALQQKYKELSQRYENAIEQKDEIYAKVRSLNEKGMVLEKEKDRLQKSELKLMNQTQILKGNLRQKQDQYTQHKVSCEISKSKLNLEIKSIRQQLSLNEKKWREKLDMMQKNMDTQMAAIRVEKSQYTNEHLKEIQKLTKKLEQMRSENQSILSNLMTVEKAYKQQSEQLKLVNAKAAQSQAVLTENLQKEKLASQQKISACQKQMNYLTKKLNQKLEASKNQIHQLNDKLSQQYVVIDNLTNELSFYKASQHQNQNIVNSHKTEKTALLQTINELKKQLQLKQQQALSWSEQLKILKMELQSYMRKYQILSRSLESHQQQSLGYKKMISTLSSQVEFKNQQIKQFEQQFNKLYQKTSKEINELTNNLFLREKQNAFFEQNAQSMTQQLLNLQKSSNQDKNKLKLINQQLAQQIQLLTSSLKQKRTQFQQLQKTYSDLKVSRHSSEIQFCALQQALEKEKKNSSILREKLTIVGNQSSILRQTFEESQMLNESLMKETEQLRNEIRSVRQIQEASHLLKMNVNTLESQFERINKDCMLLKHQKQALIQQVNLGKEENKFINDQLNSMKLYIDELEQNLQKLSEEKAALRTELNLFKQEAEFCKKQSIDQLKVVDQLASQLQTTKKQLQRAKSQELEPSSIIRRSSLSKGEKSYYVKQMIQEYGHEMKKNLQDLGALSPEEVRDLIFSELRELGNYLKKLQKDFE